MRVYAINGIQNNNQRSFSTGSFGGSSGFASIFDEKASLNNTKVKGNEAGLLATAMKKSEGISAQRFNHFYELAMARTKSGYYTEQANEPKDYIINLEILFQILSCHYNVADFIITVCPNPISNKLSIRFKYKSVGF